MAKWWRDVIVLLPIPLPIWRCINAIRRLAASFIPLHPRHGMGASGMAIPALGTTHADYFFGDIPCTRALSEEEVQGEYELNTGKVIIETLGEVEPLHTPVLSCINMGRSHGERCARCGT